MTPRLLAASTLLLVPLLGLGVPAFAQPVAASLATSAPSTGGATPPAHARGRASMERRVVRLTNKRRAKHGCRPLTARKNLRRAARRHTGLMASAGTMSHQLPGEAALGERVTAAGYTDWTRVGENVAYGYAAPRAVVRAWMRSPGHREQILTCAYRHLGVGHGTGHGTVWWTQVFGRK